MRIDMRLRGAGKTYDLVQEHMITPNSVILVAYPQRAVSIRNDIPNGEKAIVLDVAHFQKLSRGSKPFDVVFIDELETVLRELLNFQGANIVANLWGDPETDTGPEPETDEVPDDIFTEEFIRSVNESLENAKQAFRTFLS